MQTCQTLAFNLRTVFLLHIILILDVLAYVVSACYGQTEEFAICHHEFRKSLHSLGLMDFINFLSFFKHKSEIVDIVDI